MGKRNCTPFEAIKQNPTFNNIKQTMLKIKQNITRHFLEIDPNIKKNLK